MKRLVLALGIAVLAAGANAGTPTTAKADDGSWEVVCCGAACGELGDYCLGSGTRTCCRAEAVE